MVVLPMMSPALGGELMQRFGFESVFIVIAFASAIAFVFLFLATRDVSKTCSF